MKILTVDDAATVLKLLNLTLSEAGYKVTQALNADEAIGKLKSEGPFDVAIFDVNMPGKSGIELLREVKASAQWAPMKVLMLTTV